MCWFACWEVVVENGKKSKIRDVPEAAGRRRDVRASNSRGNKGRVDLEALLAGHCRQAVTLLPRGVLGVATAIEFLGALPGACRLGLPDVTDSGPRLFALLVAHGVLVAMPSPRVVPARSRQGAPGRPASSASYPAPKVRAGEMIIETKLGKKRRAWRRSRSMSRRSRSSGCSEPLPVGPMHPGA